MAARLKGAQKAAILLLSLGEDAAAEVIKNLSEDDLQTLAPHLGNFDRVTPADVERVAREFYLAAEKGRFLPSAPETKTAYLKNILNRALGEKKSGQLVAGMLDSPAGGRLEQLKWHDPSVIAQFLSGEHPQVIAVIAANLGDPDLTKQVISALPDGQRQEVLTRLLRLHEISSEWVEEIEASLEEEMQGQGTPDPQNDASTKRVAGVMNAAPRQLEDAIMTHIESQDPQLAGKIRSQMFPFEEFLKVDNPGIQRVLEQATNEDLVLALGSADQSLRRHFLRNLSTENSKALEHAISAYGPMRLSDIEAAQKRLSNIARELAAQGRLKVLKRNR
jgi:flagellar motor switch protein FliG